MLLAYACRAETELDTESRASDPIDKDGSTAWSTFWGWDCCGPLGILERLYSSLGVPRRSWLGLKQLPEISCVLSAGQQREYIDLVRTYMAVLEAGAATASSADASSTGRGALQAQSTRSDAASEPSALDGASSLELWHDFIGADDAAAQPDFGSTWVAEAGSAARDATSLSVAGAEGGCSVSHAALGVPPLEGPPTLSEASDDSDLEDDLARMQSVDRLLHKHSGDAPAQRSGKPISARRCLE